MNHTESALRGAAAKPPRYLILEIYLKSSESEDIPRYFYFPHISNRKKVTGL